MSTGGASTLNYDAWDEVVVCGNFSATLLWCYLGVYGDNERRNERIILSITGQ